jgi:hypothetical protein
MVTASRPVEVEESEGEPSAQVRNRPGVLSHNSYYHTTLPIFQRSPAISHGRPARSVEVNSRVYRCDSTRELATLNPESRENSEKSLETQHFEVVPISVSFRAVVR